MKSLSLHGECSARRRPTRPNAIRLLLAVTAVVAMVAGLAMVTVPAAPASATTTGTTVSDCPSTEGALVGDITAAGAGGTVSFNCAGATTVAFDSAITVSQDLTLDASQAVGAVTLDGGQASQLFMVNSGVTLTLDGLTLQGGATPNTGGYYWGGAIFNDGTLTVTASTFSGNSSSGEGGAIGNFGTLTVTASTFSGNSSLGGGAIYALSGSLSITGSTFSGNSSGYGGAIYDQGGSLSITGSTFSGDTSPYYGEAIVNSTSANIADSTFSGLSGPGGAIYNKGTLTVTGGTFSGNSATGVGGSGGSGGAILNSGTLNVAGSLFSDNSAAGGSDQSNVVNGGGAIFNSGTLTATGSTFSGNSAAGGFVSVSGDGGGGAIANVGTLSLSQSTLSGNQALDNGGADVADGGAVANFANATITSSTLSGNQAVDGGAIYSAGSSMSVSNSTIVSNIASQDGSAINFSGLGGGNSMAIAASTIAYNTGNGALFAVAPSLYPNYLTIGQTIFAANKGGDCATTFPKQGFSVDNVTDTGYNLTDGTFTYDGVGCWQASTDQVDTVAMLAPAGLQNNGGPTQTVALESGSPAIDAIPTSSGLCQATDQRGSARPDGSGEPACDIGAYESGYSATTTGLSSSANPSVTNQQVIYTAQVSVTSPGAGSPTGTVDFRDGGADISGCGSVALNSSGTATCAVTYAAPGSHSITATYSGDGNFLTSNASLTQQVRVATSTQVTSSVNPSVFGQAVTFTAAVSSSGGTPIGSVQFSIDGTAVGSPVTLDGSGDATYSTSSLAVTNGTNHTVSAAYTGTGGFANSSGSLSGGQEVDNANTSTSVESSLNPSMSGQSVTFTATVSVQSPGAGNINGNVTFKDGTTTLGTGTVSTANGLSTATYNISSLALGSHNIIATYGGSSTLAGSTSAGLTQNVDTNLSSYPKLSNGAYNLANLNLSGAYLVNLNLTGASIKGANLKGANLTGTTLTDADITSANFSYANLTGANLSGANLTSANFKYANLTGANLSGADLTSANFTGATFTKANLTSANLTLTNLKMAIGMSAATLTEVIWSNTTCPDNTNSTQDGGTCLGHL